MILGIFIILINLIAADHALLSAESDKSDAEYSNIKHEYILDDDGSWHYNYEHKVKLLTYFAVNRYYGESFIVYNPQWQKLTIKRSETTTRNGGKVFSPPNAFNEVLPGFASNIAPYSHLREMVVTHTGLEIGAEIDFAYSLETKQGYLPGMMGKITIGSRSPIKKFEIIIKVPEKKKLNYYLCNIQKLPKQVQDDNLKNDIKPKKDSYRMTEEDDEVMAKEDDEGLTKENAGRMTKEEVTQSQGFKTYSWEFEDIPLVEVEALQPSFEEFLPVLYFSTATEEEVIKHIISNENELYALNERANEKIKELTRDKLSDLDRVTAIRDYVEKNVGQMNCDLIYTGYRAMKAQETFDRNVGSQLDKVVLLTAMLKAAGFSPIPLIAAGNSKASDDISLLPQFVQPLVYCEGVSPFVTKPLLDPNHSQKDYSLSELKDKPHFLLSSVTMVSPYQVYAIENDYAEYNCIGELDSSLNYDGKIRLSLNGNYNPDIRRRAASEIIIKHYEKYGYKLTKSDSEGNSTDNHNNIFYYDFITSKPLIIKNGIVKISIPNVPNGIDAYHLPMGNTNRTTPLKLPQKVYEKYDVVINIFEGFLTSNLPKVKHAQNNVGYVDCSISVEGGRIKIKKQLEIYSQNILPESYKDFMEIITIWKSEELNELLIEKKNL